MLNWRSRIQRVSARGFWILLTERGMLTAMKACVNCQVSFQPLGSQRYCDACRGTSREKRAWVDAQKSAPCTDCGKCWPSYVMQFDHLPGCVKVNTIAWMVSSVTALCVLQAEVAKCELVCMNCHTVRTRTRGLFVRTSHRVVGPVEGAKPQARELRRPASNGLVGWDALLDDRPPMRQGRHWPAPSKAEPVPLPRKGVPPEQVYVSLEERRRLAKLSGRLDPQFLAQRVAKPAKPEGSVP